MSTINVTAAEDIQCGDIVVVDAATLQARRLVDGDEFVGIANEPISVGDALIMDLATGRLTKNGTDVVDVAGATLGAFDYLVSKLSADIEREDARQRPPGILTPVTAPPDALMTTLDDPRRCWGCAFYSFKTYTNQAETQGKCFRDFDATRHYWWVDGLMTCPRFQSGDTSAKLD